MQWAGPASIGGGATWGGVFLGLLTACGNDVHQDVNHNDGASASDASAVRTRQGACGQLTGQSRGPFPCRTCTAGPRPIPGRTCNGLPWVRPRLCSGPVHLVQEAKDAGGLSRDAVVGQLVLVVLHCAQQLLLGRVGW